jgi:hypothetical protein
VFPGSQEKGRRGLPDDFWEPFNQQDPFEYNKNTEGSQEPERLELHELPIEQRVKIMVAVTEYKMIVRVFFSFKKM